MTVIAVDFDGTCVKHKYPAVGEDCPHAVITLRRLVMLGHQLILFTMRSGEPLDDAVAWFKDRNIELYGIQRNPTQHEWTKSPKCYAQIYIDDAALGCPLIFPENDRPYVDWMGVQAFLENMLGGF